MIQEPFWKRLFPLQFTKRVYTWFTCLTLIAMLAMTTSIYLQTVQGEKNDRRELLLSVSSNLASHLDGSYTDILNQEGALATSVDKQVEVLNNKLQPFINETVQSFPQLGMGYYDIRLDRIVAFGPGFDPSGLSSLSSDCAVFSIYETGKPYYGENKNSIGWDGTPLMSVAYPITRNREIIGHTWANIPMDDIYDAARNRAIPIIIFGLIITSLGILLLTQVFSQIHNDIKQLPAVIAEDRPGISARLVTELNPLLDTVRRQKELMQIDTAGRFAASVVHEIRSPSTTIRGFCELLLETEDDPKKVTVLNTIITEVDEINRLVTDFLLFSQPEEPRLEPCPVSCIVDYTHKTFSSLCAKQGITLKVNLANEVKALCDYNQLQAVLVNLVENAVHAVSGRENATVTLEAYREGNWTVISVKDNGNGIDLEQMERIFEPFYSTKANGAGLGLNIARKLMELQGGTMTVYSRPGEGSEFSLYLRQPDKLLKPVPLSNTNNTLPLKGTVFDVVRAET